MLPLPKRSNVLGSDATSCSSRTCCQRCIFAEDKIDIMVVAACRSFKPEASMEAAMQRQQFGPELIKWLRDEMGAPAPFEQFLFQNSVGHTFPENKHTMTNWIPCH